MVATTSKILSTIVPDAKIRPTPVPLPPPVPGVFRITNADWTHPITHHWCELADMSDGRRIARRMHPGRYGKPVYTYWLIDPDPAKSPTPLNNHEDGLFSLHDGLDRAQANPKNAPGLLQKTPLEVEAEKFCREWPNLGHHLGFHRVAPTRSFDVGDKVWRPSPTPNDREKIGDVDWRSYLDLHGAGSFGIHGELADVGPLSAEQAWGIALEPQAVRNAEAIRSGVGVVKSEYSATGPTGREFTVRVETALLHDARKNFTYITVTVPQR